MRMKAEVIQLKDGEKVSIDKNEIGYTIIGPVTLVVLKEEAASGETAQTTWKEIEQNSPTWGQIEEKEITFDRLASK